jgi:uncharacterized protein (DUF4415 family)
MSNLKRVAKPAKAKVLDPHTAALLASIERGLQEAAAGEGRVTTGAVIAKRAAGRPPQAEHKEPVTLRLESDALGLWRASGKGWQTRAAALLARNAPNKQKGLMMAIPAKKKAAAVTIHGKKKPVVVAPNKKSRSA